MNALDVNRAITAVIKERITQKSKIVSVLSDILGVGTKAVYRRLNNEVFFTFSEICKLSMEFGFSLDGFIHNSLIGMDANGVIPLPKDKECMNKMKNMALHIRREVNKITCQPYSEIGEIANGIPVLFCCYDKELLLYSIYHQNYHHVNNKTFSEFKNDKMIQSITNEIYNMYLESMDVSYLCLLMSREPVRYALENINYLRNIRSITEEEYQHLKRIVRRFIYQLEIITNSGFLPDSQTKCDIYISDVKVNASCHFIYSDCASISSVQMYILGWKVSFDMDHNNEIKSWMDVWKQNAVLITNSNMNERIHFLDNQREILENWK